MGLKYYKLFDLLNRRNMKKTDLRAILSSATIAKLSKGERISSEAIEKICEFLDCQPGDIMEYIIDSTNNLTGESVEIADHTPLDDVDPDNEYNVYKDGKRVL